jgi:hypothetical protein
MIFLKPIWPLQKILENGKKILSGKLKLPCSLSPFAFVSFCARREEQWPEIVELESNLTLLREQ